MATDPGSPLTFGAFQQLIREKYFVTDNARGTAGTFLLLMEEVGELATALHDNRAAASLTNPMGKKRPISADERANLEEEFADVLAWLSTLANIMNVDLEQALKKYTDPNWVSPKGRVVQGIKE
jgi:NTP pyrophosphatase (non-canonical NTP hydrolase)